MAKGWREARQQPNPRIGCLRPQLDPDVPQHTGSAEATDVLLTYARWLRENPYLMDHQGLDLSLDVCGRTFKNSVLWQGGEGHRFFNPPGGLLPSALAY